LQRPYRVRRNHNLRKPKRKFGWLDPLRRLERDFGAVARCRKAELAKRQVTEIGLGTQINPLKGAVTDLAVVKELKGCDIIFGCTDDEWGRAILTRLSPFYLIPVFDMGVKIDSSNGEIKSVRGRVTTLIPGSPCLYCRGIVTQQGVDADILSKTNPAEYERRRREGYVAELPETAPAVIMFTSTVASTAVSEMLHRFTGYMGLERTATEVIHRFDESKISTNSKAAIEGCWCNDASYYAVGDTDPLLELVWIDAG
jgi:hypothetical protein